MSTSVTPYLSGESSAKDRLTFQLARIQTSKRPFQVFQEVKPSDLEDLLNALDSSGFEIFKLAQEPADQGYRSRWTIVGFRTHEAT